MSAFYIGDRTIIVTFAPEKTDTTAMRASTFPFYRQGNLWLHLLAIAIVVVWGTTFISSKQLLLAGLSPSDIIFYRFVIAYVCLALFVIAGMYLARK